MNTNRIILAALISALLIGCAPQTTGSQAITPAGTVKEVSATNLFNFYVVQQPADDPAFVSMDFVSLTQSRNAANAGSVGLIAHNDLVGQLFTQIGPGQEFVISYDNGDVERYVAKQLVRFQAVEPNSIYTDFIEVDTNLNPIAERVSVETVFDRIYRQPGYLIFQTCITNEGNMTWGRLFIIAEKISSTG